MIWWRQDQLRQVRRILRQRLDHRVAERHSLLFPVAAFELEGRVLHVDRHHVLALRREAGIGERRDCDFQIRLLGEIAVLGFVEGAFEIINLRTDVDAAAQSAIVIFAFERGELGQVRRAPG